MAKKNENTNKKTLKGDLLYTTITDENALYKNNPQEKQLALYLTGSRKNAISMTDENTDQFSFTDFSIYERLSVDEDGTTKKPGFIVIAYDYTIKTVYYTLSSGLARDFDDLRKQGINPGNDFCRWLCGVKERKFVKDGQNLRTFELTVNGTERFYIPEETAPAPKLIEGEAEDVDTVG